MTNAIDSPGETIGLNLVLAGAPRSSYINFAAFITKERPLEEINGLGVSVTR
jgi:hypothetical protein